MNSILRKVDENGHRIIVRNDHSPEREIVTGFGSISVKKFLELTRRKLDPEIDERFFSIILPRYVRKTANILDKMPKSV